MASSAIGLALLVLSVSATVVHVNFDSGNDSSLCLKSAEACKTLMYVATHLGGESNLTVLIETDIELNGTILFEDIVNITINGSILKKGFNNDTKV